MNQIIFLAGLLIVGNPAFARVSPQHGGEVADALTECLERVSPYHEGDKVGAESQCRSELEAQGFSPELIYQAMAMKAGRVSP